jgi:hypothetical protein
MSDRVPAAVSALVVLRDELKSLEPSLRLEWRMEQTVHTWAARRTSRPWASPLRWTAVAATLAAVVTAGWALHRRAGVASAAQRVARQASSAWVADAEVLRVRATLGAPGVTSQIPTSPAAGQRYWIDLGVASDGSLHVVRVMPADDEERPVY